MSKWQSSAVALSFVVAATGLAAPAQAGNVKVYSGVGCRAAELPPAPQPTFNANGTVFNQDRNTSLRVICPVVKDGNRIQEARIRVTVPPSRSVPCTLRTLREDGTVVQTFSGTHTPHTGLTSAIRDIHMPGQNSPGIGYYVLECTLPTPDAQGRAAGIMMYRIVEG